MSALVKFVIRNKKGETREEQLALEFVPREGEYVTFNGDKSIYIVKGVGHHMGVITGVPIVSVEST